MANWVGKIVVRYGLNRIKHTATAVVWKHSATKNSRKLRYISSNIVRHYQLRQHSDSHQLIRCSPCVCLFPQFCAYSLGIATNLQYSFYIIWHILGERQWESVECRSSETSIYIETCNERVCIVTFTRYVHGMLSIGCRTHNKII